MPTTITVSEATRRRLADYKRGDMTYDDVLKVLMDATPLEEVAAAQIAEHYRALAADEWVPADEVRKTLEAELTRRRTRGKPSAARGRSRAKGAEGDSKRSASRD